MSFWYSYLALATTVGVLMLIIFYVPAIKKICKEDPDNLVAGLPIFAGVVFFIVVLVMAVPASLMLTDVKNYNYYRAKLEKALKGE